MTNALREVLMTNNLSFLLERKRGLVIYFSQQDEEKISNVFEEAVLC
jgi:hypothetical protein